MQKRITAVTFLFFLNSLKIFSQKNDSLLALPTTKKYFASTKYSFTLKGEYIHQGNNYVSIGLGYLNPNMIDGGPCNSFILGMQGFSVNMDIAASGQSFHVIPKLSYEAAFMLIGAKLNLELPTDFKSNTYIFCPEIGVTAAGLVYIYYGYNFIDRPMFDISRNKLTIGVNLQKVRYRVI